MRRDERPPVVYVRSFSSDDELHGVEGPLSRVYKGLHYTAAVSPEQEMAWIMDRAGPVVAIGKPGERLPELGAARKYVDDDHWRDTITDLMARAALVVVRAGDTANLWWEIEQAAARVRPERIIVVALGGNERWRDLRTRFTETFGPPTLIEGPPPSPVVSWLRRVMMPGRIQGSVIYFDRAGAAFERPLAFSVGWQSLVTTVVSPHGAVLRATLEPILDAAGVPPRRSGRSQTVAVTPGVRRWDLWRASLLSRSPSKGRLVLRLLLDSRALRPGLHRRGQARAPRRCAVQAGAILVTCPSNICNHVISFQSALAFFCVSLS